MIVCLNPAACRAFGLGGLGDDVGVRFVVPSVATGLSIATPAIAHAISTAAWAVPVVGAGVAAVTIALTAIFTRKGPKQRVASTSIVNDLEPQLQRNLAEYLAGPHTRASQLIALRLFDDAWAFLNSSDACGSPALGAPGQACISDRQAGACVWRDEAGECWNWFKGYREPIANDAAVVDTPASDSFLASLLGGGGAGVVGDGSGFSVESLTEGGSVLPLLGAGLIVAGLVL